MQQEIEHLRLELNPYPTPGEFASALVEDMIAKEKTHCRCRSARPTGLRSNQGSLKPEQLFKHGVATHSCSRSAPMDRLEKNQAFLKRILSNSSSRA
jgi:hypothetical protein